MKRVFLFCLSALLVITTAAQDLQAVAEKYLDAWAGQQKLNGVVLLAKDNKIILQKGYGYKDVERNVLNDHKTIFQIGSVTKQFTAAIILQLQKEGRLSVKDKLVKYLPDYPRGNEISIENLLHHTSGIFNYTNDEKFMNGKLDRPYTRAELLSLFKNKPLNFKPGTQFDYSNSGYYLLGNIIEKVTGKPYEQVVSERILKPLGMQQTGFDFTNLASPDKATGYFLIRDTAIKAMIVDSTISYAAGGLYSTLSDLYKWEQSFYTGKILDSGSIKQSYTPALKKYGYGWAIDTLYNKPVYVHGGGIHGFAAYLLRYPSEKITVIILDNASGTSLSAIGEGLVAIATGNPYKVPEAPKVMDLDKNKLLQYAGEYELAPTFTVTVRVDGDKLKAQATGQPEFEIFPEKENVFFYKVVEAKIEFKKDDSGKVTSMVLYQGGREIPGKKIK